MKPKAERAAEQLQTAADAACSVRDGKAHKPLWDLANAVALICDALHNSTHPIEPWPPEEPHPDTVRLNWLEAHLSYAVINDGKATRQLPNNGRGWRDGELRAALDVQLQSTAAIQEGA